MRRAAPASSAKFSRPSRPGGRDTSPRRCWPGATQTPGGPTGGPQGLCQIRVRPSAFRRTLMSRAQKLLAAGLRDPLAGAEATMYLIVILVLFPCCSSSTRTWRLPRSPWQSSERTSAGPVPRSAGSRVPRLDRSIPAGTRTDGADDLSRVRPMIDRARGRHRAAQHVDLPARQVGQEERD